MKTPEKKKAQHRDYYKRNAPAIILQVKARQCGVRLSLAECRRQLADQLRS